MVGLLTIPTEGVCGCNFVDIYRIPHRNLYNILHLGEITQTCMPTLVLIYVLVPCGVIPIPEYSS